MTTTDENATKAQPAAKEPQGEGVVPPPPPLAPHLTVRGGKDAIAFYERAFGAKVAFRNDTQDGSKVIHASLVLPNGGVFMLHDDFSEGAKEGAVLSKAPDATGASSVTLNMDLPDVDAVWKSALEAGAEPVIALKDQFWGDRYGVIRDPFGHRWALSTRKRAVSQEQIAQATRNLAK